MDLDPWNLIVGMIVSSIGFGYFLYGKRQRAPVALSVGVLLMIAPYLIPSAIGMVVVGLLLMVAPMLARRFY